jgi:ribonuclease Z
MRPSFHPRLINSPFDDPGLYIPFFFQNRAVIFDLGDNNCLPAKEILKISHVFVTHTHMDHFIGFDRLLRILLGRDKKISLFGPSGFLRNVEGKLAGYAWNLVDKYNYPLSLQITEVHPRHTLCRRYRCAKRFRSGGDPISKPFSGILYEEPAFKVSAAVLDHQIPCLGLSIEERFHVNIIKSKLEALDLKPGPWLANFKQALYRRDDPGSRFIVQPAGQTKGQSFMLGELAEQIALITPGQKITYITDVVYSAANEAKITDLARGSDHLYIEAAFLDQDRELAQRKHHLTARQAGCLAATARVKQFTVFHFSPRYVTEEQRLYQEAVSAHDNIISQGKEHGSFSSKFKDSCRC